jgi:hypothetical protein
MQFWITILLFGFLSLNTFAQDPKTLLEIASEFIVQRSLEDSPESSQTGSLIEEMPIPIELKELLKSRVHREQARRLMHQRMFVSKFEKGWISPSGHLWMWTGLPSTDSHLFGVPFSLTRVPRPVDDGPWGKNRLVSVVHSIGNYKHTSYSLVLDEHGQVYDDSGRKVEGPWGSKRILSIGGGAMDLFAFSEDGIVYSWEKSSSREVHVMTGIPEEEKVVFTSADAKSVILAVTNRGNLYRGSRVSIYSNSDFDWKINHPQGKKWAYSFDSNLSIDEDGKLFFVDGKVLHLKGAWEGKRVISAKTGIEKIGPGSDEKRPFALVLCDDGSLYYYSNNHYYQYSFMNLSTDNFFSQRIFGPWGNHKIIAISSGPDYGTFVLDELGSLYGWGFIFRRNIRFPSLITNDMF